MLGAEISKTWVPLELAGRLGGSVESADAEPEEDSMIETVKVDGGPRRPEPVRVNVPTTDALASDRPLLTLRHRGVAITLQFSEEPSKETFEYLERWAGFEKDNALTKAEMDAAKEAGGTNA